MRAPIQRWESKVDPIIGGCWRWMGSISPQGYGRMSKVGDPNGMLAHRFAYETFVGDIPMGMQIDHLCRNRWCVNPLHLEAVTPRENAMRGVSPMIILHRMGICQNGHSLESHACRRRSTGRVVYCRACRREARREART